MMLIILKCYKFEYNDGLIYNFVDVMLTVLTDPSTYLMFTVQQTTVWVVVNNVEFTEMNK